MKVSLIFTIELKGFVFTCTLFVSVVRITSFIVLYESKLTY